MSEEPQKNSTSTNNTVSCSGCETPNDHKQHYHCHVSGCKDMTCTKGKCKICTCVICENEFCESHSEVCNECDLLHCNECYVKHREKEDWEKRQRNRAGVLMYDMFRDTYMDSSLSDCERRERVYNLCILEWQKKLEPDEFNKRSEPFAEDIYTNGSLVPSAKRAKKSKT